MKKLVSLTLVLMMVFALALPAFAAPGGPYLVTFYAFDGTTIVHQQYVAAGRFIDGSNHELYNSWSNEGGMLAVNYKLPTGWEPIPNMLEDIDTGGVFNWKTTPINKNTNVMLAVNKNFTVTFYALDEITVVCSQVVIGGNYINGGDTALYNSWSSADALYDNYGVTGNLQLLAGWLKDIDSGAVFEWQATPITQSINVTLAQDPQYDLPASPVTPGELRVEPPTLINLGFEWYVEGDENVNARVSVFYREEGTTEWLQGMDMIRVGPLNINPANIYGRSYPMTSPNMFAGSIIDLQEDTAYECKFVISDPDGVIGNDTETVTVRTRPEPVPYTGADAATLHVYPRSVPANQRQTPNYNHLMDAYLQYGTNGDWAKFFPHRVKAGDTILVHAGLYIDDPRFYSSEFRGVSNQGTPFDGTYHLTAKGTEEKPISIIGCDGSCGRQECIDGAVIYDGDGNFNLFNVLGADYHIFQNLTIRNTKVAFLAGIQDVTGCLGLSVKNCIIEDIGKGVDAEYQGCKNFYIADNVFQGRNSREFGLQGWNGSIWGYSAGGYPALLDSYYAVKYTGNGHVICFNYVADFHDGIDSLTVLPPGYVQPDGSLNGELVWENLQMANDVYNNFITVMTDNPMETDGSMYNIRIMRNVCLNSAEAGISMQPVMGGPVYWIRNIFYHLPASLSNVNSATSGGLKMSDPAGGILLNNTICVEAFGTQATNIHWRNNLIMRQNPAAELFGMTNRNNYSTSDYNGFYPGVPTNNRSFKWYSPDYTNKSWIQPATRINRYYATLREFAMDTGQDTHSILLDYSIFEGVPEPVWGDRWVVNRIYEMDELDFSLKADSAAVDAGMFIPNVTDDYTGDAPDLGALEYGVPVPTYGPRS
ncbi:MAG: hypothetical protein FWH28_08945 [Clostridiales bacterium]|nr:hypothetical protein [Clostridiales bacterium]